MDLARLKHLVAVVDTGSIRRAAELSGCSPAAMSKSIKTIERQTGVQVVRPDGRGIRATVDGQHMAARARRVLDELEQFEVGLRQGPRATALRLASFEPFTTYFLGELAAAFPETPISVAGAVPGEIEHAIATHAADVGLTYAPRSGDGLEHRLVGQLPMGVYVAASSDLRHAPARAVPFVVPARLAVGPTVRNRNADGWPDDRARRVVHEVTALESALELCRRGLGAVYMPRFVARLHNEQFIEERQLTAHRMTEELGGEEPHLYLVHRSADEDEKLIQRMFTTTVRIVGEAAVLSAS